MTHVRYPAGRVEAPRTHAQRRGVHERLNEVCAELREATAHARELSTTSFSLALVPCGCGCGQYQSETVPVRVSAASGVPVAVWRGARMRGKALRAEKEALQAALRAPRHTVFGRVRSCA